MTFLTLSRFTTPPIVLKTKANQLNANQLIDVNSLLHRYEINNDPKTYYNRLHWSILEMNSGREINMFSSSEETDSEDHFRFIPTHRHTTIPFNHSLFLKH